MKSSIRMALLDSILNTPDCPVENAVLGKHLISIKSRYIGMATWAVNQNSMCEAEIPEISPGASAKEIASWLNSDNNLKASIGLAALNSLIPTPDSDRVDQLNAAFIVEKYGKGKNVAVIGHFPFVEKMREDFQNFSVLEMEPKEGDISADKAPEIIPHADLLAITSTTISNGTIDNILELSSQKAKIMLIGPSTPFADVLFDNGIDYLAGCQITDYEKTKRDIINGHPFRKLSGVRHIIWRCGT